PERRSFVANATYESSYTAKEPTVNGVGFAAGRDWNALLRYETKDSAGTANPLAGDITRIYTECSSQPCRFLNDFRYLGFNEAENGKPVFDRSEEHTSELQSRVDLVCRLLLEKKKNIQTTSG